MCRIFCLFVVDGLDSDQSWHKIVLTVRTSGDRVSHTVQENRLKKRVNVRKTHKEVRSFMFDPSVPTNTDLDGCRGFRHHCRIFILTMRSVRNSILDQDIALNLGRMLSTIESQFLEEL